MILLRSSSKTRVVFYWSLLYKYFILTQSSDVRLQDSQERMLAYERRSNEHTKLIAELTQKVREKSNCEVSEQVYSNLLARDTDCFNFFSRVVNIINLSRWPKWHFCLQSNRPVDCEWSIFPVVRDGKENDRGHFSRVYFLARSRLRD